MIELTPFKFVIVVTPTAQNPQFDAVAGAFAHVLIYDGDQEAALLRAVASLIACHWKIKEVQHAFEFPVERLQEFDANEIRLFRRAQSQGFAVDFVAWRKED